MPSDATVVDASVFGAFLFQEPRAEEAAALLAKSGRYIEPNLLPYELASIARAKIARHPEHERAIVQALTIGLALDYHFIHVDQVAALALAASAKLTIYDAAYLFVARALDIPLLTFDQRLSHAASTAMA